MSTDPPTRRLRPRVTDALVASALEELAEIGYGQLSMEAVARRGRASKATLYRRWGSKRDMVLEALATISPPAEPTLPAASLESLVRDVLDRAAEWLRDPLVRRILPDLLAEGLRDEAMGRALTASIGNPRRAAVAKAIEAAIAAGQARPDADVELVVDLMAAPIFWRVTGLRSDVDAAYLAALTQVICTLLAPE